MFSHKSKLDQKLYIYVTDAKGHRFAKTFCDRYEIAKGHGYNYYIEKK